MGIACFVVASAAAVVDAAAAVDTFIALATTSSTADAEG